jgi:hypothetical protein
MKSYGSVDITALYLTVARRYRWVVGFTPCWRMPSSGMLHRVALVRTDVSEELSASFIRVTRIGELWTTLAVTSNWLTLRRNTKKPFFIVTAVKTSNFTYPMLLYIAGICPNTYQARCPQCSSTSRQEEMSSFTLPVMDPRPCSSYPGPLLTETRRYKSL